MTLGQKLNMWPPNYESHYKLSTAVLKNLTDITPTIKEPV